MARRSEAEQLAMDMANMQKTMEQILDVEKAQLVEIRRLVDMLDEMSYVDGNKKRRLGVADLKVK